MEKRLFKAVLTFTTRPGSVGRSVGGTDARCANLQSFTFYSRYTFFSRARFSFSNYGNYLLVNVNAFVARRGICA